MNEELLLKLYNKYGLSSKGDFERFKSDMGNPEIQRKFFDKYGLSGKGTFEKFQSDLGAAPQPVVEQPEEAPVETPQPQKSLGFLGSIKEAYNQLVDAAKTPKDPNQKEAVNPLVNAYKRGSASADQTQVLNTKSAITPQTAGVISKAQQEIEKAPPSESYSRFTQAKGIGDAARELARDPASIILELTTESLTSMGKYGAPIIGERASQGAILGGMAGTALPGIGTAAGFSGGGGAGAVTGMAETSLDLEYSSKFLQTLQESGVNIKDPVSLQLAFQNDEIMERARTKALQKSIPIAIFDLISGGIAGKIVTKPAKSLIGKLGQGMIEMGVQSGLGMAGEASGQVVSGEELSAGSILAEGIGELATAPVEVYVGAKTFNAEKALAETKVKTTETINEVADTGDPIINAEIDAYATPTPEEEVKLADNKIESVVSEEIKEDIDKAKKIEKTKENVLQGNQVLTFKTAKGSTYTVKGQSTTRNKAARPEHPGDSGIKETSLATVYIRPEYAGTADIIYTHGVKSRDISRVGNEVVITDTLPNGNVRKTRFPYEKVPQIGLHPFEVFDDGNAHLGNKITEINSVTNEEETNQKEEGKLLSDFTQSPEYIAADEKVRTIADQIRENPTTELTSQLNEALQERDNARIAFEQKPPKKAKQEPIVVNNPAQALKEQIQTHYKLLQEGVKKGQKLTNETLITKVTDVIEKARKEGFEIGDRKVSTILNRVKKTNLFTPGSVSRLNDFVGEVFNNAMYVSKLDDIKALNRRLKKMSKASSSNLQNVKSLARAFASINPEDVGTMVDQHLSVGNELLSALTAPSRKGYSPVNTEATQTYINDILEKVSQYESEEVEAAESGESNVEEELRTKLKSSLSKLQGKDLSEFDESERRTIELIKGLDPEKLGKGEMARSIRVVDNIVENDNLTNVAEVETDADKQQTLDELRKLFKSIKVKDASGWYSGLTNNAARTFDEIVSDNRKAATFRKLLGQTELASAGSIAENQTNQRTQEVEKVLKDFEKATNQNFLDANNRIKTLVYALFARYPKGQDPNTYTDKIKSNIEKSINEYTKAGEDEIASAFQSAFDEVKDLPTAQDITQMFETKYPNHKKVFDYFKEMFEPLADRQAQVTAQVYNKPYVKEENYTSMDTKNINDKGTASVQDLKSGSTFTPSATTRPRQSTTSLKAARALPPGFAYDTDWVANQLKAYHQTLYDIEAAKPQLKLKKILASPEFTEIVGKDNADVIRRQTDRLDEVNRGLGGIPTGEFIKTLAVGAQIAKELGAAYALASLSQVPKQATVLVKALAYHASTGSVPTLLKSLRVRGEGVKKLHDMYPIGTVGLRLGGIERGDTTSLNLSEGSKKKAMRLIEGLTKNVRNNSRRALTALTMTDKFMKQSFWNSYYIKRLNELGVENVNMNEEWRLQNDPKRKEAAAFAEQMIATTQITSNPGELSAISRPSANQAENIIKNVLLPFSTYAIEAKARLMVDMKKAIRNPSSENIIGGVVGDIAEIAAFAALQVTLLSMYKDGLDAAWRSLFGIDDPNDEEKKERKQKNRENSAIVNALNTANPLAISTFGEDLMNSTYNRIAHSLFKIQENPDISYSDWKKETGGFAYQGDDKSYGLYSVGIQPILNTGQNVINLVDAQDGTVTVETPNGVKEVDLTQGEKDLLKTYTLLESMSVWGLSEADIFGSIRRVVKEQLNKKKGESTSPGRPRRPRIQRIRVNPPRKP